MHIMIQANRFSQASLPHPSRQGHVWGVARIGQGGNELLPVQGEDTLAKMANVLLEPQQKAKTFKDPEANDIIVSGEDLDVLEAQKNVLDQARHHGDKFIINTAQRNLEALKCAVSVNATFVDASVVEDNPEYLHQLRPLPKLEAEGDGEHFTPNQTRGASGNTTRGKGAGEEGASPKEATAFNGMDQFMLDVSTLFNDAFTPPDVFFISTTPPKKEPPQKAQKSLESVKQTGVSEKPSKPEAIKPDTPNTPESTPGEGAYSQAVIHS
jgi:hypothetical protein